MNIEDDKGNPLIGTNNEITICGTYQEGSLTKSQGQKWSHLEKLKA